jgi:hypothetical protein
MGVVPDFLKLKKFPHSMLKFFEVNYLDIEKQTCNLEMLFENEKAPEFLPKKQ